MKKNERKLLTHNLDNILTKDVTSMWPNMLRDNKQNKKVNLG